MSSQAEGALGRRFCGLVAIQPGHALAMDGLYGTIRNPNPLGLLVGAFGWALAFRSDVGVLLAALRIPPLAARMRAEEVLPLARSVAGYEASGAAPGGWSRRSTEASGPPPGAVPWPSSGEARHAPPEP